MGQYYEVTRGGDAIVEFNCPSCHYQCNAAVAAIGSSTFQNDRDAAAGYRAADVDFQENAYRLLDCVACPSCGFVDKGRIWSVKTTAWFYTLAPSLLVIACLWMFGDMDFEDATDLQAMGIVAGGIFVICFPTIFLRLRSRWWANAKNRVEFLG